MIALTAYGINKAVKKRKAKKELELQKQKRDCQPIVDPSEEVLRSSCEEGNQPCCAECGSSRLTSNHRPASIMTSSQESYSPSAYSASIYADSPTSPVQNHQSKVVDIREYQQYLQRQSNQYLDNSEPPSYAIATARVKSFAQELPADSENTTIAEMPTNEPNRSIEASRVVELPADYPEWLNGDHESEVQELDGSSVAELESPVKPTTTTLEGRKPDDISPCSAGNNSHNLSPTIIVSPADTS